MRNNKLPLISRSLSTMQRSYLLALPPDTESSTELAPFDGNSTVSQRVLAPRENFPARGGGGFP